MERAVLDCPKASAIFRSYNDVLNITLTDIEHKLCSAMVDAVRCVLGRDHKSLAVLADILMCIYLTDLIHSKIQAFEPGLHEADGQDKTDRQYAVLVGDYLLSESFMQLNTHQLNKQINMRHLTGLVKTMKRGALLRWKLGQKQASLNELPLIWEMERGTLLALCGRLAAEILEADAPVIAKFESLGRCLGMAWAAGIEAETCAASAAVSYLAEANELVSELKQIGDVSVLREILNFLSDQLDVSGRIQGEAAGSPA